MTGFTAHADRQCSPPKPVRLPHDLIDAVIDRATREGLTRSQALATLIEFALTEMPAGWRGDTTARRKPSARSSRPELDLSGLPPRPLGVRPGRADEGQ
ncbi:hypothetical protein [Pseudonocardia acidicola]|uniref:Ribbon-helix-helix CopG family protein n=1 Tax=Pseudonocardia acidicola TaxID=2724939 RepID=A0ABX1SEH5_9PSEU|nr:hypothetical protein [Pseudonocardia acidicola]NMH98907.1 hypothetical protein [Pseudonocardia acidicola]